MALTQATAMLDSASTRRDLLIPHFFARAVVSFDPVSVRVNDEGGVVIRVIHRPQTGRAVVPTARAQRRRMKRIDGRGIRRRKAEMQTGLFIRRNRPLGGKNPERDAIGAIPVTRPATAQPLCVCNQAA